MGKVVIKIIECCKQGIVGWAYHCLQLKKKRKNIHKKIFYKKFLTTSWYANYDGSYEMKYKICVLSMCFSNESNRNNDFLTSSIRIQYVYSVLSRPMYDLFNCLMHVFFCSKNYQIVIDLGAGIRIISLKQKIINTTCHIIMSFV